MRFILFISSIIWSVMALGQINTLSSDKPLAFLNPSLQNVETNKGIVSASYLVNPLVEDVQDPAYLISGEYNLTENIRFGINSHSFNNRLNGHDQTSVYASFRLPLEEKGSYFNLGLSAGFYNHTTKIEEFNKVYAPNKYFYTTDSLLEASTSGVDIGFGMSYSYNGLTVGLGLSKLNGPERYLYPRAVIVDSGTIDVLSDTAVLLGTGRFEIENNINVMYEWDANKNLTLLHAVHISDFGFGGVEYIGLQNLAEINNKHSLGLGVFYNGSIGFIGSAGFGFTENIRLGGSVFLTEDLNYDEATENYESSGWAPAIEANLQIRF